MDVVTYHYVRPETAAPPAGYYHLPLEQFRAQLDHFAETRTFVSRSTFFDCLRGSQAPPADGVVLSFDDGLADHYRWVWPELERRGLWGVFFVPTDPLVGDRRLAVTRVHTLVANHPGDELLAAAREVLAERDATSEPAASDGMYAGRDTAASVRAFKTLLNQRVPYEHLPAVLDELERRFAPTDAHGVDTADLYLTAGELGQLSTDMVVGAHSVSHPVLARLSPADQRAEIRRSKRDLAALADGDVDLFAYPYGGEDSYTALTRELVESAGFEAAFTTESGSITAAGVEDSSLALPRRDCTEFAHGESSASLPGD